MNSLTRGAITRLTFFDALEIEGMHEEEVDEKNSGGHDDDVNDDDDEWRNRRREGEDERAYTRRRERNKERERERARDHNGGSSEYDDHRPHTFDTIMTDLKKQLEDIAYDERDHRVSPERLLRRALSKYGVARDGAVTNEEVEKALAKIGARVSRKDIVRIFDELDTKNSGYLDVGILAAAVFPSSSDSSDHRREHGNDETSNERGHDRKNPQTNGRALPSRDTDGLILQIRKKMEITLGAETNCTARAKEVFSEMDRDGSGAIDKSELSQAMHVLNIEMTEDELDALFRRFAIVNPAIQSSAAG